MKKIDDGLLCNDVEVPFVKHEDVITLYDEDQFFGPVVKAMEEEWPQDQIQRRKLEKILRIVMPLPCSGRRHTRVVGIVVQRHQKRDELCVKQQEIS